MTNTTKHYFTEIASSAVERAQRAHDNCLASVKEDPAYFMVARLYGWKARLELAVAFRDEGIARAVTLATAWRDIIDDQVGTPGEDMVRHAQAKGARSWLYSNETYIKEAIRDRLVSDEAIESIISDLITGG